MAKNSKLHLLVLVFILLDFYHYYSNSNVDVRVILTLFSDAFFSFLPLLNSSESILAFKNTLLDKNSELKKRNRKKEKLYC